MCGTLRVQMRVPPLAPAAIERFAVSYYAQYAKRLDPKQIATLVVHPGAPTRTRSLVH